MASSKLKKRMLISGVMVALLLIGGGVYFALSTWGEVNRVTIERPGSDPEDQPPQEDGELLPDELELQGPVDDGIDIVLLVGSDSRDDLMDAGTFGHFEGARGDVIMVLMRSGSSVGLLSLPRDLWVEDRCNGGMNRINAMLAGCGDEINGPTLLTLTVEDLIGHPVDHFAMVDFDGFRNLVDAVGGYEICVDRPVRDQRANLELEAGCTMATGDQALAWLRSRNTQELTDRGWLLVPGMSDLVRNERQREFLISMLGRLSDLSSPGDMASTAQALAPHVTVDSDLSLITAVNIGWTLRGIGTGAVVQLEVPVYDHVTPAGAEVLIAESPVDEIVAEFLSPATAEAFQAAG